MTLVEIRRQYPELFYDQDWFDGHGFMEVPHDNRRLQPLFTTCEVPPGDPLVPRELVRAVDLAFYYTKEPEHSVWKKFLWTDDVDAWGSRIYVGGLGQYGCEGFQIHRHLQPACWWVRTT